MLVALVSEAEVDTGAVLGGGLDEVRLDTGNVQGQSAFGFLRHLPLLHRPDLWPVATLALSIIPLSMGLVSSGSLGGDTIPVLSRCRCIC